MTQSPTYEEAMEAQSSLFRSQVQDFRETLSMFQKQRESFVQELGQINDHEERLEKILIRIESTLSAMAELLTIMLMNLVSVGYTEAQTGRMQKGGIEAILQEM